METEKRLTIPYRKNNGMLRIGAQGLGLGRILWNDQSNEKWAWGLGLHPSGSEERPVAGSCERGKKILVP
jgi:hypothetical protein